MTRKQKPESLWAKHQSEMKERAAQQVIECNLAENAIDYLVLAGEQAKQGTARMLKHAVATLADGIELLLKARLEAQNWHQLFDNIDQAEREKYLAGDFQSVTLKQAKRRLAQICGVSIGTGNSARRFACGPQ
jgi:hypothetical protein